MRIIKKILNVYSSETKVYIHNKDVTSERSQAQDSAKSNAWCILYNKLHSTEMRVQWKNVQVPMNFLASSFHCSPLL